MQELLLAMLPQWHYRIIKPFKHQLDEGISLEMYYCIQIIKNHHDMLTMSELGKLSKMPKQQVTKIVNRLIECEFAQRIFDPSDRRIIRLKVTDKALKYVDNFLGQNAICFKDLFEMMDEKDREDFADSLSVIFRILKNLPQNENDINKHEKEKGNV